MRLFAKTVGVAGDGHARSRSLLALPTAFFVAKIARRWIRRGLIVSMMLPLWAGYMVKTYAWRTMVAPAGGNRFAAEGRGGGGVLQSVLGWTPGYSVTSVVIALTYLWFPYMLLPIYAGLERLPVSLLDASGDLGAKPGRTFRSVIVPILLPSIAAGSIFTFSLSLGDYILPRHRDRREAACDVRRVDQQHARRSEPAAGGRVHAVAGDRSWSSTCCR